MVEHAAGIERAGFAAHNLEGVVFPVVNVAVNMQMSLPVSVPLADGEMAQTDLIFSVCYMAHFFNGFKITDGSAVVQQGLVVIADEQMLFSLELL